MTVFASAEWGSLLPLADGTHQVVRGLTLPKVTHDAPMVDMVPLFEHIKKQSKGVKDIQNIKVPRVLGGEIK